MLIFLDIINPTNLTDLKNLTSEFRETSIDMIMSSTTRLRVQDNLEKLESNEWNRKRTRNDDQI